MLVVGAAGLGGDGGRASGRVALRCRLTFNVSDNTFTPTDGSDAHTETL